MTKFYTNPEGTKTMADVKIDPRAAYKEAAYFLGNLRNLSAVMEHFKELADVEKAKKEAEAQVAPLKAERDTLTHEVADARRSLSEMQDAASELVASAKGEAARILDAAQAKAVAVGKQADADAADMLAKAKAEAEAVKKTMIDSWLKAVTTAK
jgi:hypothetical protein